VGALSVALGAYVLVAEDERGSAWKRAPRALLLQVPPMLLILGTTSLVGSLRIADAVRLQGVLPWDWNAFRDPAWLLLAALWFAAFVVRVRDASWGLPEAMPLAASGAARVSGVLAAALGTVLFFGGWRVPAALEVSRYGDAATLLGIALFAAKASLFYWLLAKSRDAIAPLRSDRVVRFALVVALPLVLVALALGTVGYVLRPSSAVQTSLAYGTFGGALLLVLRAVLTVRSPTFRTDIALS
jgi:NADH:ubiquinone oxidoreductase subunit H